MAENRQMEDLAARLTRLSQELAELEEILTRDAAASDRPSISLKEIYDFKRALDHMRRVMWMYLKVFSKLGENISLTDLHRQLTAAGCRPSDDLLAAEDTPLGFFEEMTDLVSGLLREHGTKPQLPKIRDKSSRIN